MSFAILRTYLLDQVASIPVTARPPISVALQIPSAVSIYCDWLNSFELSERMTPSARCLDFVRSSPALNIQCTKPSPHEYLFTITGLNDSEGCTVTLLVMIAAYPERPPVVRSIIQYFDDAVNIVACPEPKYSLQNTITLPT